METGIGDDKRLDLIIANTILMLDRIADDDDLFDPNDIATSADLAVDWKAIQEDRLNAAGEEVREGDVVRLKSGGVMMTVETIVDSKIWVVWLPQTPMAEPIRKVFPSSTLDIIKPPSEKPASPKKEQTPSIGRIVRYKTQGDEGEYRPAIIVSVVGTHMDHVNLCVFDLTIASQPVSFLSAVAKGDEKGQWSWPPYVP